MKTSPEKRINLPKAYRDNISGVKEYYKCDICKANVLPSDIILVYENDGKLDHTRCNKICVKKNINDEKLTAEVLAYERGIMADNYAFCKKGDNSYISDMKKSPHYIGRVFCSPHCKNEYDALYE